MLIFRGRGGAMVRMAAVVVTALLSVSAAKAATEGGIAAIQVAQEQEVSEIQLRSFMAPVKNANPKGQRELPVTVIMVLARGTQAFFVCEMTPRLRDAMLETLYNNPVPLSAQNVMDLSAVEPLLLEAANKALRGPLLTGLQIKQGAEELKAKSSRSRASIIGCAEIEKQHKQERPAH